MTTISYKDGIIAADSQVSLGSLICNNDFNKVQRFDSQEFGSVYVGAAGTLSHIAEMFDFIDTIFSGEQPDAIKFGAEHFQVVMLTEDGELKEGLLTESSTNILWIDCEQPYAIGSGSHIAIGAMAAGATAEEAVKLASKHDCYTNDNVKVYCYKDLSYVNLLKQQRDYLDQQIESLEAEAEEQAEAFIEAELEGCEEFEADPVEDTSGHEYQLGGGLNKSCAGCFQCTCEDKDKNVRAEVGVKYDWDGSAEFPWNLREGDTVKVYFREGSFKEDDFLEGWDWNHDGQYDDIISYELVKPVEETDPDGNS